MTEHGVIVKEDGQMVEVTGSVVSDTQVEVTGSVASDQQVEVTGSVASDKQVEVTGSVASDKQVQVKEVISIILHAQDKGALYGMVVYNQHVYVVHGKGLIVYCYTPDGSLSHKYEHKGGEDNYVYGMCLMMERNTSMLVVSDATEHALVWIKIIDGVTMEHDRTQHLDFIPFGLYGGRGDLMVCDAANNTIHRYRHGGQTPPVSVIYLPDDVKPWWVTHHGDGDHYVLSDFTHDQVVLIDNKGQVKIYYEADMHGVKLGEPRDFITDPDRGVLIADSRNNHVLLLMRTGDVVKILDQHVRSPRTLYLDTDHHRLYVSGTDQHKTQHVFIFTYCLPADD